MITGLILSLEIERRVLESLELCFQKSVQTLEKIHVVIEKLVWSELVHKYSFKWLTFLSTMRNPY